MVEQNKVRDDWYEIMDRIATDADIFTDLFEPVVIWRNKFGEEIETNEPIYDKDSDILRDLELSDEDIQKMNDIFWDMVLEKHTEKLYSKYMRR